MKTKIFVFTLVILAFFSINVSAISLKEYDISASFDEKYTVITYDNAVTNKEYIEKIGYTVSSLRAFFTKNNVILMASDEQNGFQVQISCTETDFSKQIKDISAFDQNSLSEISESVAGENSYITEFKKQKYICTSSTVNDDEGTYLCTQYITFVNGKMYCITFYDASNNGNTQIDDIMSAIRIKNKSKSLLFGAESVALIVFIILLILAATICIIVIIIRFIRERRENPDAFSGDTIKRRKM